MHRLITIFVLTALAGCSEPYRPTEPTATAPPAAESGPPAALPSAPAAPEGGELGKGGTVELGTFRLQGPETWTRKQPRSNFVMVEFALPRAEGDSEDGRLTVSQAGGSVEANVDRWRQQFGGKPEKDTQKEIEAAGVKVQVVDFAGTFQDQAGPFAPAVERKGYRMLAAIIPSGDMSYFVKCYGPEKTMAQHAEAFEAFIKTLAKP